MNTPLSPIRVVLTVKRVVTGYRTTVYKSGAFVLLHKRYMSATERTPQISGSSPVRTALARSFLIAPPGFKAHEIGLEIADMIWNHLRWATRPCLDSD
jgi:hypothetical protein